MPARFAQRPRVLVRGAFCKHLLATFLGLLMALALESWHEAHQLGVRAEQARQAIGRELDSNVREIDESLVSLKAQVEAFQRLLKDAQAARSTPEAMRERVAKVDFNLKLADLQSAAWEAATAARLVHQLPFELVEGLGRAYGAQRLLDEQQRAVLEDFQRLASTIGSIAGDPVPAREQQVQALDELVARVRGVVVRIELLRSLASQARAKDLEVRTKLAAG